MSCLDCSCAKFSGTVFQKSCSACFHTKARHSGKGQAAGAGAASAVPLSSPALAASPAAAGPVAASRQTSSTAADPPGVPSKPQPPARPPKSASGAAAPTSKREQKDEIKYPFGEHLQHKFDLVSGQAESGLRVVKRARSFFERFGQLQRQFGADLHKAIQTEQAKLVGMKEVDRMQTCRSAWLILFEKMGALADAHAAFGAEVASLCVEPLEKFHAVGLEQAKENKEAMAKHNAGLNDWKIQIAKGRGTCNTLLQDLSEKKRQHEEKKDKEHKAVAGAKGGGFVSGFMSKIGGDKEQNMEKAREKAKKACEAYVAQIATANIVHHQYHQKDLPAVLERMQSLEETRLWNLSTALDQYAGVQDKFMQSIETIASDVKRVSNTVNIAQDMNDFVSNCIRTYGKAPEAIPFEYDMATTPEELSQENFNTNSSLFGSTLEGVMKHQQKADGGSGSSAGGTLDIPRILPTLTKAVEDSGGLEAEGIFRISSSTAELAALKQQLESGDYEVKRGSPHTPAAMLKAWLRDLATPLIPFEQYEACVAIGKEVSHDDEGAASAAATRITAVLKQIPPINRRVVAHLAMFMEKIAAKSAVNKMTPGNLAIVFAPSFLRDRTGDPMVMLQDSKHACNFIVFLVETAAQVFADEHAHAPDSGTGTGAGTAGAGAGGAPLTRAASSSVASAAEAGLPAGGLPAAAVEQKQQAAASSEAGAGAAGSPATGPAQAPGAKTAPAAAAGTGAGSPSLAALQTSGQGQGQAPAQPAATAAASSTAVRSGPPPALNLSALPAAGTPTAGAGAGGRMGDESPTGSDSDFNTPESSPRASVDEAAASQPSGHASAPAGGGAGLVTITVPAHAPMDASTGLPPHAAAAGAGGAGGQGGHAAGGAHHAADPHKKKGGKDNALGSFFTTFHS